MRVIECRSCGTPYRIKPQAFEDNAYPNKIHCVKCWSKPAKSSSVYVGSGKRSNHSSRSNTVFDKETGNEFQTVYEVGDSVFINTDKYGVLLVQILDTECWNNGEHIFYTVDAKGTVVDYVEEEEIFNSAEEATSSGAIIKVF